MTTPTQPTDGKLKDNDYIYQHLMYLHRQEHIGEDCFCTTEIAGAYKNILGELARREQRAVLQARVKLCEVLLGASDAKKNKGFTGTWHGDMAATCGELAKQYKTAKRQLNALEGKAGDERES